MREQVNFNAHAQIKSIIGKDLINDDNIAVVELVKNAIDAQSGTVNITFKNLLKNDDSKSETYISNLNFSTLLIQDDGIGMSYDDIVNKWLNIAYSEKKHSTKKYAGSKGVGRFSCDRLGEFLNIYTRKTGGDILNLHVNWNHFEVENEIDLKIQDVKLVLKKISEDEFKQKFNEAFLHGTILEISKLRTPWLTQYQRNTVKGKFNRDKLMTLKISLGKIVSPNIELDSHAQLISLSVPILEKSEKFMNEISRVNGIIENKIFKDLNFKTTSVVSNISNDGKFITTSIIDKDREILRIKEVNVDYPDLKAVQIKLYYLNPYAKAYFKRQTGIRSVDYGCIFLFLGGFRVSKLGDIHDDWLGLERRKAQGRARYLASRELIGHIEINDPDHNIGIISAREGITKTPVSEQLTIRTLENNSSGFFYKTLRRLERYVVDGLDWDATQHESPDIEKLVDSGNWNEESEKYDLSHKEKIEKIYQAIGSIVDQDTKKKNILDLYINFDFFAQESENIAEKAQKSFDKFVKKHNIDISSLDELKQLKQQIKKVEYLAKQAEKEKNNALATVEEVKEQANIQVEKSKESEKKAKKCEQDALNKKGIAEKQSLFLKSILARDDHSRQSQHLILQETAAIINHAEGLLGLFKRSNLDIPERWSERLSNLIINARKAEALSKYAIHANHTTDTDELSGDVVAYIKEYIENILKKYPPIGAHGRMAIAFINHNNSSFERRFMPIRIMIVLDNLISNSIKNNSSKIYFIITGIEKEQLILNVTDDGYGINSSVAENLFEPGITTTKGGAGLGLFHAKKLMREIGGSISVDLNVESGAKFTLRFKNES